MSRNTPKYVNVTWNIDEGLDISTYMASEVKPGTEKLLAGGGLSISITSDLGAPAIVINGERYCFLNNEGLKPVVGTTYMTCHDINIDLILTPYENMTDLTVHVEHEGTLNELISKDEAMKVRSLKLTGNIDEHDFVYLNEYFYSLERLDLSDVTIMPYNFFPTHGINDLGMLTYLTLPDNLKGFDGCALNCARSIRSIIIPEGVEYISPWCFGECRILETFVVKNPEPIELLDESPFYFAFNYLPYATLYVPAGAKAKYEVAPIWNNFPFIVEYEGEWISHEIELDHKEIELLVGESIQLHTSVLPEENDSFVRWSSLYDYIASVDENGLVTSSGTGDTRIFASCYEAFATCDIHVRYQNIIEWTNNFDSIRVGKSVQLNAWSPVGNLTYTIIEGADLCEISGDILIPKAEGFVTIEANSPGTPSYTAAEPVRREFRIKGPLQMGDANDDGIYTVSDITHTAGYILGTIGDNNDFFIEAADIDKDGEVLVNDLTAIVDLVLDADNVHSAPIRVRAQNVTAAPNVFDLTVADGNLTVNTSEDMAAAQFDLILQESAHIDGISLAEYLKDNHMLSYRQLDGNRVRVIIYSLDNATINSGELAEVQISFDSDMTQQISLTNALYDVIESDGKITEHSAGNTSIFVTPSGLGNITKGMKVYTDGDCIVIETEEAGTVILSNVLGAARSIVVRAGMTRIPVQSGIYFINNQKLIIR